MATQLNLHSQHPAKRSSRKHHNARGVLRVLASTAQGVPLACPVVLKELDISGRCMKNGLKYGPDEKGIWDLTIGAGIERSGPSPPSSLQEAVRGLLPRELKGFLPTSNTFGTSTFELPSVAYAYERGWRQGFATAGFPGPDKEFELAQRVLLPAAEGGLLIDASCGSGLFTRRFVQSGCYSNVVALDYSDSMLTQTVAFFDEKSVPKDNLTLVRADIGRIPFPDDSVDGVHSGAAIHCWPNPKAGVAEIARVLKPGASYCGTTFMNPTIPFLDDDLQAIASSMMRGISSRGGGYNFWDKRALKQIFESCGFTDIQMDVRNQFVFYSMRKPVQASPRPMTTQVEKAVAAPEEPETVGGNLEPEVIKTNQQEKSAKASTKKGGDGGSYKSIMQVLAEKEGL